MQGWKTGAWLTIDTETTGLDPAKDRIIELGALLRPRPGADLQHSAWLLDPGMPIPAEASALNGITNVDVAGKPQLCDIAEAFLALVRAADILVGYNWPFDAGFLAAGLGQLWATAIAGKPIIDPLVVVRFDDVGRYWRGSGRHKLGAVAERFGVRASTGAHRVAADCEMTLGVLGHLLGHLPDDADAAARLIIARREQQDADFRAWMAREKKGLV